MARTYSNNSFEISVSPTVQKLIKHVPPNLSLDRVFLTVSAEYFNLGTLLANNPCCTI